MQKRSIIEDYLRTAGEQIRWKRARKPLLYELESHILDRRESLISDGVEEIEAETKAVAEMGDAETVGIELDRVHQPRPNWLLISSAAALFALGILLLWLIGGPSEQFKRMIVYGGIGIVFLILGYFCDYTLLAKYSVPIFAVLCTVCFIFPIMGNEFRTIAKQLIYALPFVYSMLLFNTQFKRKLLTLSVCAVLCLPVSFLQSNSSMIYVFVLLSIILVYAAFKGMIDKNRFKSFIPALCVIAAFSAIVLYLSLYDAWGGLSWRVHGIVRPESDPYSSGWVTLRVRELINTSVFVGAGETSEFVNQFTQSTDFANVEFMLATAAHKYGYILFIAIGLLLAAILGIIVYGIKKQSSRLGKLTLLAGGSSFAIRIAAYLMCNLGFNLIALDGIPLFSYNGKLLIFDMFVMGLMLSVFRMESIARDSNVQAHRLIKS